MLKCAGNDDIITMKADDTGDVVTFMFESPGECPPLNSSTHEPCGGLLHTITPQLSDAPAVPT